MFPGFVYSSPVSDLPGNGANPAMRGVSGGLPSYNYPTSQHMAHPPPRAQEHPASAQSSPWSVQYSSPGSVQSSNTMSSTPQHAYVMPGTQQIVWGQVPPLSTWPSSLPQPLPVSSYMAANGQPMHIVMDTSSASPHSSSLQAASMSAPYTLLNIHGGHTTFVSGPVMPTQDMRMSISASTSYNSNSARNYPEAPTLMSFKTVSTPPQQTHRSQQQQQQHQQQQQRRQHSVGMWGYALVDQLHPFLSRVPVPPSAIFEETAAMQYYNNDVVASSVQPCASSVCLLFSNTDRCASGSQCRSFHVKRDYLALSRAEERPLCCALHNCFYSQEMMCSGSARDILQKWYCISMDADGGTPQLVPISVLSIGITVALETLPVHEGRHIISMRRHVCRLHLEGRCKWTKDCGHVHICREVYSLLQKESVRAFVLAILNRSESSASLYSRIAASEAVQAYVRSSAGVPLLSQLMTNGDVEGITALLGGRVACTQSQWECLQAFSGVSGPGEITLVAVSPKVAPFLVPSAPAVAQPSPQSTPPQHPAARSLN